METNNKTFKTITEKNTWINKKCCDCVSKPFFRLVLKPNL